MVRSDLPNTCSMLVQAQNPMMNVDISAKLWLPVSCNANFHGNNTTILIAQVIVSMIC